jgi:8-hydroxy-5-deazaflavin:NADPH oxidoreductase
MVGDSIASKLVTLGHEVMMGSRSATNEAATAWALKSGPKAKHGTFSDCAAFGELLFNCTEGVHALDALKLAGEAQLAGKVLVDVSNPLDFSKGMPPTLTVSNTDSLGEQIQRAFPSVKVVKVLNTVNCEVMVDPSLVPGEHNLFLCGNDEGAKSRVTSFLAENFRWKAGLILDLGDITQARATESLLPLWVRLYGKFQNPMFNFHVVQGAAPKD